MKQNFRRIRSQNSLFETVRPPNTYNWRDEYFTRPTQSPVLNRRYQERNEHDPQQYDKLIKMYQMENEEIKKKNGALIQNVRELKDREERLMEEVAELEAHYRKLLKVERGYHGEENGKESKGNCKNFYQSQVTNYSPQIDLNREVVESGGEGEDLKMHYVKQTREKEEVLKHLNEQFCAMVEQSINERDPESKRELRREMAQLATHMKRIRNNEMGYKIENEYGIGRDKKMGGGEEKKIEEIPKIVSYQSLSPYLQINNNKMQILTYSNRKKSQKNTNNSSSSKRF